MSGRARLAIGNRTWMAAGSWFSLILAGLALVFGLGNVASWQHNTYDVCDTANPPVNALPFEAASAGHSMGYFPVGISCLWNMRSGRVESSYEGDWAATILFYGAGLLIVGGIVGLRCSTRVPVRSSPLRQR